MWNLASRYMAAVDAPATAAAATGAVGAGQRKSRRGLFLSSSAYLRRRRPCLCNACGELTGDWVRARRLHVDTRRGDVLERAGGMVKVPGSRT